MSKWLTKFGTAVVAAGILAGCGGDDGGTTTLSQSQKTALTQALSNTEFGAVAAYVVQVVGRVGTLDPATVNAALTTAFDRALSLSTVGVQSASYEGAVGIAVEVQSTQTTGWFYGVVGWNGINTSNNTVDEVVLAGGAGETGSLPSSASGTIEDGDVLALYETPSVLYYGISGEASVSASSFSGATDCSASQQGITIECSYSTGTMNGNFLFTAESITGASYTQPKVSFTSLPAVRITLSITQG